MNERTKQIIELVRYSTKIEMTLPYGGYLYRDGQETSLANRNDEIIKQLMNDDKINVELIECPEETKVIVEMIQ